MEQQWIKIYTTNNIYHAEMIKKMLADNEIESFIINKMDSSYFFGDIEIYTLPDLVMRSKLLIDKFEH